MAEPTQDTRYADAAARYRLDARIATGGMGEVWRATDTVLDRQVAVKVLKQEHAEDALFRTRFETEAQHAAGLHHPGIAQVYDFGSGDPTHAGGGEHAPYLVMEYVDGKPLSALLRPGQPMDPEAAAALVASVGDALGAAHARGIVHRDVKPANLIVTDGHRVKVTDFGIARAVDAAALTRTGDVMGTPQYLSPEQAEGTPTTPASDVYSLGAVAFECLTGRRPYVADTPVATALAHLREPVPDLPDTVPPALAAVVRRALAKEPGERYADGTAFAAAVREAVAAPAPTQVLTSPVPVAAAPEAPPAGGGLRERARRVPVPVWAVAGVFVLVLVVAAATDLGSDGHGSAPVSHQSRTPVSRLTSPQTSATSPATSPGSTAPAPTGHTEPGKPPKKHGHKGKGHQ
jgi:serine/threonine-protein kinase